MYFLKSSLAAIASNRFPELAIYLETEIKVVEHELLSLHKVMVKLELEMKEAMDTEGKFPIFYLCMSQYIKTNIFATNVQNSDFREPLS